MWSKLAFYAAASVIVVAAHPASAEPKYTIGWLNGAQLADEPGTPPQRRVVRQQQAPPPPSVQPPPPPPPAVQPPYEPYGYFGIGGVFMGRTFGGAGDRTIIRNDSGATCIVDCPQLLSADGVGAFDDFKGGIEAKGGVRIAPNMVIAVRFLWIGEFRGERSLTSGGDLGLPFLNDISSQFDGANSATVTHISNFHTLSLGPRYRVNQWLVVGAGFRYVHLTESIFITMNDGDDGTYNLRVRNRMLGGELNASIKVPITERFMIGIDGAAGFLYNSVRVTNDVFDPADARANRNVSDRRGGFSFLGEVMVTGVYSVEHWLKIYAGYRAMFLTGVGTGAHNLDFNSSPAGITQSIQAENGANVIYHGGVVGVKIVF